MKRKILLSYLIKDKKAMTLEELIKIILWIVFLGIALGAIWLLLKKLGVS